METLSDPSSLKTYRVNKIQSSIELTGLGNDPSWSKAVVLDDFTYPWREEPAPKTEFRALWTETHFYFLYHVADDEIITPRRGLGERDAVDSDRVEIFFKADDQMDPYYALEMDALGRCLDTEGKFYRNIEFDWNWPEGHFVLKASQHPEGYVVEGSITLSSLTSLGLYHDDRILRAGLYRGEYASREIGEIGVKWISWVLPDSEKPDFHIPSSFGILKLED